MHMNMPQSLTVCVVLLLLGAHLSTQDMVSYVTRSRRSVAGDSDIKVKPIIRSLHITSDIKYRYATTLVSSRVVNLSDQAGEAVFYVTLPESAFISEFLMEVKGEVCKAYVKEKEEAKTVYDKAVETGQSAGHVALDARDSKQFSVSVNIEAQGKVTFNLTYEQLLTRNLRVYTNTININPEQIVEDMSVTVNIEEPTPIKYLEVITLDVSSESMVNKSNLLAKIEEKNPNHKTVVWAPTPEEQKSGNTTGLSCQFVVKYDVDRKGSNQQILVDEGYFVHFFAPENLPPMKKHVVFVLDYSISMSSHGKREQLEAAMYKILSDLDTKDYFSIIIFHDSVEAWSPTSIYSTSFPPYRSTVRPVLDARFVIKATPTHIAAAHSYLKNYQDLGLTNIMEGLRTGLQMVSIGSDLWKNESDPPQPVIIFLTDGQPTAGTIDTDTIISDTRSLNTIKSQIFCLAFGYDADFNFLRKLSLSNYAMARKIYESADASDQLNNFYKTISSPLLSNVTFTYLPEQVDYSSRTKADFLVFFNGSEIVVAGKLKNQMKVKETIGVLSGLTANGPQKYPIVIDVTSTISETPSIKAVGHLEKMWAYLKIQQLLDEADSLDQNDEIVETKKKALKLALQYCFVTPLTSLVVVKPNESESAVDTTPVRPGTEGSHPPNPTPPRWDLLPKPDGNNNPPMKKPIMSWDRQDGGYNNPQLMVPTWMKKKPQNSQLDPKPGADYTSHSGVPRWAFPVITEDSSTIPPPRWPKAPTNARYRHPISGLPYWPENDIIRKISLDDIGWLHSLLMDSKNSNRVPVSIMGKQFILALNQTDLSFGTCSMMGMVGECHHIQYCALDILQNGVTYLLPVQCLIPAGYLGVCCPHGIA